MNLLMGFFFFSFFFGKNNSHNTSDAGINSPYRILKYESFRFVMELELLTDEFEAQKSFRNLDSILDYFSIYINLMDLCLTALKKN